MITDDNLDPGTRLPAGTDPSRPGWMLVDYQWDAGVGRFAYRKMSDTSERRIVLVEQPAAPAQDGWYDRPFIAQEEQLRARYFEELHRQLAIHRADPGAYAPLAPRESQWIEPHEWLCGKFTRAHGAPIGALEETQPERSEGSFATIGEGHRIGWRGQ